EDDRKSGGHLFIVEILRGLRALHSSHGLCKWITSKRRTYPALEHHRPHPLILPRHQSLLWLLSSHRRETRKLLSLLQLARHRCLPWRCLNHPKKRNAKSAAVWSEQSLSLCL